MSFFSTIFSSSKRRGIQLIESIKYNKHPDPGKINSLIENGADLNVKDKEGLTALHIASEYEITPEIAELLLKKGADVNARDKYGRTPLHMASIYGTIEVSRILLEKGADINSKTNDGFTPLCLTLDDRYRLAPKPKQCEFLIEKGADINAKTNDGITPLHLAALRGNNIIAYHLIKKGANINSKTNDGFTPLQLALSKNTPSRNPNPLGIASIIQLLLEKIEELNQNYGSIDYGKNKAHMKVVGNCSKCDRAVLFIPITETLQFMQEGTHDLIQAIATKCPKCETLLCASCAHASNQKCPDCRIDVVRVTD